jgi:hypothetical protein
MWLKHLLGKHEAINSNPILKKKKKKKKQQQQQMLVKVVLQILEQNQ